MKNALIASLFCGITLFVSPTAHAQNLITNGSFENVNLGTGNWGLFTSITGWTATTGKIEVGTGGTYGVTGYTGNNVMELDSDGNATIQQTLSNLTAGTYVLDFDYARRGSSQANNSFLFDVLWNGNVVGSYGPTSTTFSASTINLTAVTGTNTLAFRGAGVQDTYGALVDNVRLTGASSNTPGVPEPATLALLGCSLPLALLLRRRTR